MLDALRMYQGQIFGFVGVVVFVAIAEGFIRYFLRFADSQSSEVPIIKKNIGRTRNVIIVLALIGFGWAALHMAAQNEIPRKILDRSGLQDQINKDR